MPLKKAKLLVSEDLMSLVVTPPQKLHSQERDRERESQVAEVRRASSCLYKFQGNNFSLTHSTPFHPASPLHGLQKEHLYLHLACVCIMIAQFPRSGSTVVMDIGKKWTLVSHISVVGKTGSTILKKKSLKVHIFQGLSKTN